MKKQIIIGSVFMAVLAGGLTIGSAYAGKAATGMESAVTDAPATVETVAKADPFAKPGFYTEVDQDGRLWVFEEGSEDLKSFKEEGKPARQVRRPAAGPNGVTVISTEMETITAYIVAKPGFYTEIDQDGRLWVFEEDSDDLKRYKEEGKPARQVRRPAAGPLGITVISTEMETIDAYLAARP